MIRAIQAQAELSPSVPPRARADGRESRRPRDRRRRTYRLFRRQHEEKFLSSFEKLGLEGLPHAVACAKYQVLSNSMGGVAVEYIEESCAPEERPPDFDPARQPEPPAAEWSEERLAKARRNYAVEYIRNVSANC